MHAHLLPASIATRRMCSSFLTSPAGSMARFRFRAQVWALALACLLPLSAQARTLAQQAPNPFLAAPDNALGVAPASQAAAPAAAPASEPVSPFSLPAVAPSTEPLAAPSRPPAPPASAPAQEAGTAAATDGVQAGGGDPCACTATGLSGGANTSRIGCGQFDLVSGSAALTCFVNVSALPCTARYGTAQLL